MRERGRAAGGALVPIAGPAGVMLLVVLVAGMGTLAQQRTVTLMLVHLVFVLGLYVFIGNSGVLSFGHASFMGIGAYATALLTIPELQKSFLLPSLPGFVAGAELPDMVALVIGMGVAMLVALLLAAPLMRLSGLPAGIATLAVLIIVFVVLSHRSRARRARSSGPAEPDHVGGAGARAPRHGGDVRVPAHWRRASPAGLARGRRSGALARNRHHP